MKKNVLKKVLVVGGGLVLGTVAVLVGKKIYDGRQESGETGYDSDEDYFNEE